MRRLLRTAAVEGEEGHALPALAGLAGGAGAVVLGIGAANDSGVTAVIGGIVLGVGLFGYTLLDHIGVDYNIFGRLEKLEGKDR
jgi:hypothetical protein